MGRLNSGEWQSSMGRGVWGSMKRRAGGEGKLVGGNRLPDAG